MIHGGLPHLVKGFQQDALHHAIHLKLLPDQRLHVLHPLEIVHDNAAGGGNQIGDDGDLPAFQCIACRRGDLGVAALQKDGGLELLGVFFGDDGVDGAQRQYGAGSLQHLLPGNLLYAGCLEVGQPPPLLLKAQDGGHVQPLLPEDTAGGIAEGDDPDAQLEHLLCRRAAYVAQTGNGGGTMLLPDAQALHGLLEHIDGALSGGLGAPPTAAQLHRLSGDDAGDGRTGHHAVGVHDPAHNGVVGAHIGCGNVHIGTDHRQNHGGIAPGQTHQLAPAQLGGIHRHAALGAAEGQAGQRAFQGHLSGKPPHGVVIHRGVEAHAALIGPQQAGMLHPVALKDGHRTVVHFHRHRHDHFPLGELGKLVLGALQPQNGRRPVDHGGEILIDTLHGIHSSLFAQKESPIFGKNAVFTGIDKSFVTFSLHYSKTDAPVTTESVCRFPQK